MASCISTIALLLSIFIVKENELLGKTQKIHFIALSIFIIFDIIIDTIALNINGKSEEYNTLFRVLKCLEFSIAPIIPAILGHFIARRSFWQKIHVVFYSIIGINFLLELASLFYPIMFRIDDNSIYYRTFGTYVYVLVVFTSIGFLLACSIKTYIQNSYRISGAVLIILFIVAGLLFRVLVKDTNADWLSIAFSYFLFLEFFTSNIYKVDALTSLLNQQAYQNKIKNINFSTAFIVIDINNFKHINDTHGHLTGDKCLRKIGDAILNVYGKIGYCYRSGGDEFTIIVKPNTFKYINSHPNKDRYELLNEFMVALDKKIRSMSKKDPLLKDGVSQGFGIYYIPSDCPIIGYGKTVEEALKYADDRMYEAKQRFKESKI